MYSIFMENLSICFLVEKKKHLFYHCVLRWCYDLILLLLLFLEQWLLAFHNKTIKWETEKMLVKLYLFVICNGINTIIKCGTWSPVVSCCWNEMIFYHISEFMLSTLIQRYNKKSFHFHTPVWKTGRIMLRGMASVRKLFRFRLTPPTVYIRSNWNLVYS